MIKKIFIFAIVLFSPFCNINAYSNKKEPVRSVNLVDFNFNKRDLKDVLNEFAQLRGINILYSSTTQLNAKVSFDAGKKITFNKAWELILMMLELAGFSLVNQGKDLYALIGADLVNTTPLPVFINVDSNSLPLTQERIRYVYYFKNVSLTNQQSELTAVLKNFFDQKSFSQQVVFDANFNSVIMTAKAETIKTVMQFIDIFDQTGERQIVDIFQLDYASSSEVATILTNLIGGQDASRTNGRSVGAKSATSSSASLVFSPSTKIVSLFGGGSSSGTSSTGNNSNSIVITGKKSDVEQVKKFIKENLDLPIEEGKSFFHVIDIQWLQASTLAAVLQNLVTPPSTSSQSTSTSLSNLSFDPQIKIIAESIAQGVGSNTGDLSQPLASGENNLQRGSNKLIIAATNKDWNRIEEVIKKLDIPQKQVIIEALVLDLSVAFTHKLAAQVRTNGLSASVFPKSMQAQAAMLFPLVTSDPIDGNDSSQTVEGDLSTPFRTIFGSDSTTINSTMFMVGNAASQGIWALFQLLAHHSSSKTVSRAFVIAQNNSPAEIYQAVSKRLPGKLTAGVTATVQYQTIVAPITITFTPLISKNDIVNLQIDFNASNWTDPNDGNSGTANTRQMQTNFSLKSGQVAVLGGLTKDTSALLFHGVPFLSKIPIIGSLFSNKNRQNDKEKLFVLIRATVTEPRPEGGMGKITERMVSVSNHLLQQGNEDLFGSLKDPISRWVFEDTTHKRTTNGLPLHDLFMRGSNSVAA